MGVSRMADGGEAVEEVLPDAFEELMPELLPLRGDDACVRGDDACDEISVSCAIASPMREESLCESHVRVRHSAKCWELVAAAPSGDLPVGEEVPKGRGDKFVVSAGSVLPMGGSRGVVDVGGAPGGRADICGMPGRPVAC